MSRVLIAPNPIRRQPGSFREVLLAAGLEPVDPASTEDCLTPDELASALPGCVGMLAGGELITAEIMDLAPGLRVIARTGVGYDAVDVAAATARGISVTITPGTNHDSVAEHAFALLLAVSRRIALNDRLIREGIWERTIPLPLRGKTLGLVGLGRIGRAMVPRARAFGMRVVAIDPFIDHEFDASQGIERLRLETLLAESDVVSLHLPLTPETRGLIGANELASMKPGSILLNTARGPIVDEKALAEALVSGHLAGAGLDVMELEPPSPSNPLLRMPQVVLSPHLAGVDTRSMADMAELAARCVVDIVRGEWPHDCLVNRDLVTQ